MSRLMVKEINRNHIVRKNRKRSVLIKLAAGDRQEMVLTVCELIIGSSGPLGIDMGCRLALCHFCDMLSLS